MSGDTENLRTQNSRRQFLHSGGMALAGLSAAAGVRASFWDYPEQHKMKIYSEVKWWHHAPVIPAAMPGNEQVNRSHIFLPLMHEEAPELIDQYAAAFKKVWAHRGEITQL